MTHVFTARAAKTEAGYLAIVDATRFDEAGSPGVEVPYYGIAGHHRTRAVALAAARRLIGRCEAEFEARKARGHHG